MLQTVSKSCPGTSGQVGPKLPETKKEAGCRPQRPAPRKSFLHQRRQFHEHIGHPAPELFIVPLKPGDLLRVHAESIGMDGHLIEIVGAPADNVLQRDMQPR